MGKIIYIFNIILFICFTAAISARFILYRSTF